MPEREQTHPFEGDTTYPSPFIDVLGITIGEDTYVPAFSSEAEMLEWSPDVLQTHTLTGEELCKRMPEDWWITLNPGSELGKEFSPW